MLRKFWYLSDLSRFCASQKLYTYEANDETKAIVVSIPAQYNVKVFDAVDERFLNLHLKACHTLTNRNHTEISHEVMEENMSSILNCPILADVQKYQDSETGEEYYDFAGHSMEVIEDPETGEQRVNYIERPVGVIPANTRYYLKKEANDKREYLHVDGLIYEEHGNLTSSILRKRKTVDCSVEIAVSKMHYDLDRNVLVIDAFKFIGVTLLGKYVQPGMQGSSAFTTFEETQITYSNEALLNEVAQIASKLEELRARIEYKSSEKGGKSMNKIEELLQLYGVTMDDLTFEYENMTDEELEAAFQTAFAEDVEDSDDSGEDTDGTDGADGSEPGTEGSAEPVEEPETESPVEETPDDQSEDEPTEEPVEETPVAVPNPEESEEHPRRRYEIDEDHGLIHIGFDVEYDELRLSLYRLLEGYRVDDDDYVYIVAHYLDTQRIVFCNRENIYRRVNYTVDNNLAVSIGEPVVVRPRFVTEEEDAALTNLCSEYDNLLAEVQKYRKQADDANKAALLQSNDYALIANTAAFKALDVEQFTFETLRDELDKQLLLAAKTQQFSLKTDNKTQPKTTSVKFSTGDAPENAAGGFLSNLEKRSRGELK